jgi:hypothetical protein
MPCPAYEHLLQYFTYSHLPPQLQLMSEPFGTLATHLVTVLPDNHAEVTTALRKLLEAKDCAVRAALPPRPEEA